MRSLSILKSIFKMHLFRFINYFYPKRKEIVFFSNPDFTDNSKALFDYFRKKLPKYKLHWIVKDKQYINKFRKMGISVSIINSLEARFWLLKSKIIINDHCSSKPLHLVKRQIYVNLWHGIPLKSVGHMDKTDIRKRNYELNDKNTITISTSDTVSSLFGACFHVNAENIYVTGQPRNDKLFSPITDTELLKLVDMESDDFDRIVFYMPTFRQGYINRKEGRQFDESNIFGFENFNKDKFSSFLEENRILFLCKLHPFEEKIFKEKLDKLSEYVTLITNNDLFENNIDLYSLIAKTDILITDYSSVYFDYLLINKPIIFTPTDIEEYRKKRGFVLEPYDFWAPGPKAFIQEQLQNEIIKCLENSEYYKKERETVNNIINRYKDNRSSERVAKVIMKKLEVN